MSLNPEIGKGWEENKRNQTESRQIAAVTGGTGFIGRRLVMALVHQGCVVRVLTRVADKNYGFPDAVELFEADLSDSSAPLDLFVSGVDVLYHCAGVLSDAGMMGPVHIDGTKRLIAAASNRIKHWVQLSSIGVYGRIHDGVVDEDSPVSPCGRYETTKAESDRLVIEMAEKNGFTATLLRPANVYGKGMTGQSLEKMIKALRIGLFFFIGPDGATINFIHVDDVVNALILCGKACRSGVYNLSDTRTMEDFVSVVNRLLGKDSSPRRLPESLVRKIASLCRIIPGFPLTDSRIDTLVSHACYSRRRIEAELDFHQTKTLEQGLKDYIYENQRCSDENMEEKERMSSQKCRGDGGRPQQFSVSSTMLWVMFFCFTAFSATIFQEFLLPAIPSLHAGNGLLTRDPLIHHNLAIAMMERIQAGGWSEWGLWQAGMSSGLNSSLLAILYFYFGPEPSLLIPIHAALHATAGVMLVLIAQLLWPGKIGWYGGLITSILFILFPSSINWYAQPLKDGYIIAGLYLIFYSWLRVIPHGINWRELSIFTAGNLLGGALVFSVKPYVLQMIIVILPVAFSAGLFYKALFRRWVGKWRLLIAGGILASFFILSFPMLSSQTEERYNAYTKDIGHQNTVKDKNDGYYWEKTYWIPEKIDHFARELSTIRFGLTSPPESYHAYSTIDRDIMPSNLMEMIQYLPRGLQIALWAPFPNTWFKDFSFTRAVGWFETCIWYMIMPGMLITLRYKRSPEVIAGLVFSFSFLLVLGYVTANVGTLHRVRYPYLFILILVGLLGWTHLLMKMQGWWTGPNGKKALKPASRIEILNKTQVAYFDTSRASIVNAGLMVSVATIVSYLLLFLRDLIMARRFGLGHELDGFYLAMTIPMFIVGVISTPFGAMAIPVYQETYAQSGDEKAQAMIGGFVSFIIMVLLFLTSVLLVCKNSILNIAGWGFTSDQLMVSQNVLPFGLIILLVSGPLILGNSILNAHHRFIVPVMAQIIVPIVAIICLHLLGKSWGITSVAVGMCIGQMLNLMLIIYFLKQEKRSLFPERLDYRKWGSSGPKLFAALSGSALFANSIIIIDNALASTLEIGSVGAYGLGVKVVLFVTGVIGASIVTIMLPYFSSFIAKNQANKGEHEFRFYLVLCSIISIPLGLVLFSFTGDLVQFAFASKAVGEDAVGVVSKVAAYGIIQIPFFACYTLMAQFLNAVKAYRVIALISFAGLLLNIGLDLILIGPVGVAGLSLSTSMALFVNCITLLIMLCSRGYLKLIDILHTILFWLIYLAAVICIRYEKNISLMICLLSLSLLGYIFLQNEIRQQKS